MKNSRLLPRLKIEGLRLSDELIQVLRSHTFRTVQDIISFGISDMALLCGIDRNATAAVEAALDAPPECVMLFSERTPFREANSFEEKIEYSCSAEFLRLPTANLSLTTRAARVLGGLHLETIADVLDYGIANLARFANVGEATCTSIEDAILDLLDGQSLSHSTGFRTLLDCLLPTAPGKREIVEARFGFETGQGSTLRDIGRQAHMSMERIRQIIIDEMRKITLGKAGIALNLLIQRVDVVLIRNGHIAALEDIMAHAFFRMQRLKRVSSLISLLVALFPRKYRIIDDHYLTSLSPADVVKRTNSITSAYKEFRQQMAMAEVSLIKGFLLSPRYVLHCLRKRPDSETPPKRFYAIAAQDVPDCENGPSDLKVYESARSKSGRRRRDQ